MGFIVMNDFNRNVDGCEIADQTFGKGNLHAGFRQWLALFAHKHARKPIGIRSEEHTSELQSLMRISYAVFCLKKKNKLLPPTWHDLSVPMSTLNTPIPHHNIAHT